MRLIQRSARAGVALVSSCGLVRGMSAKKVQTQRHFSVLQLCLGDNAQTSVSIHPTYIVDRVYTYRRAKPAAYLLLKTELK